MKSRAGGSCGEAPELASVGAEVVVGGDVVLRFDASLGGKFVQRDHGVVVSVLSGVSTKETRDVGRNSAAGCKESFLGDVGDAENLDEDFVLAVVKFINDSAHCIEFEVAPFFPVSDHDPPICSGGFLDTGFACNGGPGDGSNADHSENWGQIHAEEC